MYIVLFLVESYVNVLSQGYAWSYSDKNPSIGLLHNRVLYLFPLLQNLTKLPVEGALLLWGQRFLPSRAWVL